MIPDLRRIWRSLTGDRSYRELVGIRLWQPELAAELGRDVGVPLRDLEHLSRTSAKGVVLQHRMMRAFGLPLVGGSSKQLQSMREVSLNCAACIAKRRCERELSAGTAAANAVAFCPNAPIFSDLAVRPS